MGRAVSLLGIGGCGRCACAALLILALTVCGAAGEELKAGARAPHVHRTTLYDHDGQAISPEDEPVQPYSPRVTCGKCHDYQAISGGWHFSSADPRVDRGRPAQPWVLVDERTGTELPLSARGWPGAYRPSDVGLTPWQFVQAFGRHLPGGDLGGRFAEKVADPQARWKICGKLEIDCMACHSADATHDQSERSRQVARQNFKWLPTAAAGLAVVRGDASKLPDDFDPLMPPDPDHPEKAPPAVLYAKHQFDANQTVFFNITRRPSPERCYFCHTNRPVGEEAPQVWEEDQDVHLAAGLKCVDCHRHGLDHKIARGYEGEVPEGAMSSKRALSCSGCHLGARAAAPAGLGGRLGAPRPRHAGLPASHLEKLTCTACHSGPWPAERPRRVQTSRAHALGIASHHLRDDNPPYIVEPVFVLQDDGKIAPHRMMWPAFWGRMKDDEVWPIAPGAVVKAAADVFRARKASKSKKLEPLTAEQVTKALFVLALSAKEEAEGQPVYVCGGKLWRLGADGKLVGAEHPAAKPYSWPLAHDVRPAAQSLGMRGCTDCHVEDAGLFYGQVVAGSPSGVGPGVVKSMYEFQGLEPALVDVLALTMRFRPLMIWACLVAAGVSALALVHYAFVGLAGLRRRGKKQGV